MEQDALDYLILMKSKEEMLVEELCGSKYSRELSSHIRYKTSKKTILCKYGKITHNFVHVKNFETNEIYSPLLKLLGIEKNQRLSLDFKQVLARKAGRTTYQAGIEDIEDSFSFKIGKQTLHNYVQDVCSPVVVEDSHDPNHEILLADGTKVKGKGKKHEVKSIISIGEGFDDKVLLKQAINKTWNEMASALDLTQYKVFVGDGETGLAKTFTEKDIRFHFCHEHAKPDLAFFLWKDGLPKKEYKIYCDQFTGILECLKNSTKKNCKKQDWIRLQRRIRWTKREINTLATRLLCNGFEQGGSFLQRNKNYFTTAAELAIIGLNVPFSTNGIERLMQEVGKRTKKKGMYWSERGLQNVLKMVLKRYFQPNNRRYYKDIFASKTTEGIKS